MGYRPPRTNYLLQWAEDHRLHGLVVEAKSLRLGAMLDMASMYVDSGIGGREDDSDLSAEDIQMMLAMFRMLVGNDDEPGVGTLDGPPFKPGVIISWNREDDNGDPVPVSMKGIRELELFEFQEIMEGYLQAGGAKLEDPLSDGSPNGKRSEEPSALTELESLSHPN